MSMQSEGKDAKGRNYDQVTKDGSTSIGTLGAGSTSGPGDLGRMSGERAAERDGQPGGGINTQSDPGGNMQGARTDDLLSDGTEADSGDGFMHEEAGELQTGMGGIGSLSTGNAGSRQSEGDIAPDTGGQRSSR